MDYDYREVMKIDISHAIDEYEDYEGDRIEYAYATKEDAYDGLYDLLFVDDSVTGNASGSYTFSTWGAEENICHNWGLLAQALWEFGCEDVDIIEKGAEWCDVMIRCYLLSTVLSEVLDERWEKNE